MELQLLTVFLLFMTSVSVGFVLYYTYRLTMFVIGQEDKYNGVVRKETTKHPFIKNLTYKLKGVTKRGAVSIEPETIEQERKRLNYESMTSEEKRLFDAGYDPTKTQPRFKDSTKEQFKKLFKGRIG